MSTHHLPFYHSGRFPSAENVNTTARPVSASDEAERGQSIEPLIGRPFGGLKKSVTFDATQNYVPPRLPRSLVKGKTTSSVDPPDDDLLPPPRRSAEKPPRRSAEQSRNERRDDNSISNDEDNEREYTDIDSDDADTAASSTRRKTRTSKQWPRRGLYKRRVSSSSPERSYTTEGSDSGGDYENIIGVQSSSANDRTETRRQQRQDDKPPSATVYNLADEISPVAGAQQHFPNLQKQRTGFGWQQGSNYRRQSSLRPQQSIYQRPPSVAVPAGASHAVYPPTSRPSVFHSREEVSRLRRPSYYESPYPAERMPPMPSYPTNARLDEHYDEHYGDTEKIGQRRTVSPIRRRTQTTRQSKTEEPESTVRPGAPLAEAGEAGKSTEDLNLRRRLTGQERLEQRRKMQRQKRERRILAKEKTMHKLEDELNLQEQLKAEQQEIIATLEKQRDELKEQVADLEAQHTEDEGEETGGTPPQVGYDRDHDSSSDLRKELEEARQRQLEDAKTIERLKEERRIFDAEKAHREVVEKLEQEKEQLRLEHARIKAELEAEKEKHQDEDYISPEASQEPSSQLTEENLGILRPVTPDEGDRPYTPPGQLASSHDEYSPKSPTWSIPPPRRPRTPDFSPASGHSASGRPLQNSPRNPSLSHPEALPHSRLDQVFEAEEEDTTESEEEDNVIIKPEETSSVEGDQRRRLLSTPFPEREWTMDTGTDSQPRKPLHLGIRPPSDRQGNDSRFVYHGHGTWPESQEDLNRSSDRLPRRPRRQDTIKTEVTEETEPDPQYIPSAAAGRPPRRSRSPVWWSEDEDNHRPGTSRGQRGGSAPFIPRLPYNDSNIGIHRTAAYPPEPIPSAYPGPYPHENAEWYLPRQEQVDRYIIQPMLTRAIGSHQGSWILARKVAEAATAGQARVVVKQLMSRKKLKTSNHPYVVSFDEIYLKACLDSSAQRKLTTLIDVAFRLKRKRARGDTTSGYSLIFVENCTHSIDVLDGIFDLRKSILGDDDDDFLTWVKGMEGLKKKGLYNTKGSNSQLKSFTWEPFGFKDGSGHFPRRVRRLQFTFEFYVPYKCPGRANCHRSDLRLVSNNSGSHSHVFIQRRSVLAQVSLPSLQGNPYFWTPRNEYTCIVVDRPTSLSPEEENVFFNTLDASRYRFRPSFQLSEATDKWYMGACIYFIIRDTLRSWEILISVAIDHVKCREDEVVQNPTDQQHTTNLWSDRATWLELSTLLDSHISTIGQIRNFAVETFEIPPEAAEELFDDIYTRTDDIARSIEKQLQARTDNLVQFVFNYMNSHDTQISLEQGKISASTGISMHRLSWVTFVFLPLTFLAGIFGMNVDRFSEASEVPIKWYFICATIMLLVVIIAVYVMKFWRRGFRGVNAIIRWFLSKRPRRRNSRPKTEDIESWLFPEKKIIQTPRYQKSPLLNGTSTYPTMKVAAIAPELLLKSAMLVDDRPISPKGNPSHAILPWRTLMQPGPEPMDLEVDPTASFELHSEPCEPSTPVNRVNLSDVTVHLVVALGMSGYSVMCHASKQGKSSLIGFTSARNFDLGTREREYSRLICYQQDQMSTYGWGDIDIKSVPHLASNLESALVKAFAPNPTDRIRLWPTVNVYVIQRIFDDHHYAMRLSNLMRATMPLQFRCISRSDAIAMGRVSVDRPVLIVSHVTPSRRRSATKLNTKGAKTSMSLTWLYAVAETLPDVDFTQVLTTYILDAFDERKLKVNDNIVDIEEVITTEKAGETRRVIYGRNRKVGWGTVILHGYAWLCEEGCVVPDGHIFMHQSEKTFQISLVQLQKCFEKYTSFIANFFRRQIKSVLVGSSKKPALLVEEGLLNDHAYPYPLNPPLVWKRVFSKLENDFEKCIYSDGEDMMRNVLENYSGLRTAEKIQILDTDLLNGRLIDHGQYTKLKDTNTWEFEKASVEEPKSLLPGEEDPLKGGSDLEIAKEEEMKPHDQSKETDKGEPTEKKESVKEPTISGSTMETLIANTADESSRSPKGSQRGSRRSYDNEQKAKIE